VCVTVVHERRCGVLVCRFVRALASRRRGDRRGPLLPAERGRNQFRGQHSRDRLPGFGHVAQVHGQDEFVARQPPIRIHVSQTPERKKTKHYCGVKERGEID